MDIASIFPLHDIIENFCVYLDICNEKVCPKIPLFSTSNLDMFKFSKFASSKALEMFYFHYKHKYLYCNVLVESNNILKFKIQSTNTDEIYNASIISPKLDFLKYIK